MTIIRMHEIYITKRCGRLANRIIIFANIIAYAEEYQLRLRNYTFHTYCKEFEATCSNFHCEYPPPTQKVWQDKLRWIGALLIKLRIYYRMMDYKRKNPDRHKAVTLDETSSTQRLDTSEMSSKNLEKSTIFIHNWKCRCPIFVRKHQQLIREYFKPIQRHRLAGEAIVDQLKNETDVVIGIHIRQGDYKDWKNGRFYFTSEEYAAYMKSMEALFPNCSVSFIICTNEVQDLEIFSGLNIALGPGSPVSDLYTLSLCDYILGPVSTFSQWASFYGQKPLFHLRKMNEDLSLSNFTISDLQLLKH